MKPHEYETMFVAEDRHWWYVGLRQEIARHLNRIQGQQPRTTGRIQWLDAGCGTGGLLAYEGRVRPDWHTVGLERAEAGIQRARSRGLPSLVQGTVDGLPFRENLFHVITSIDVLYHTGIDELQALREMARVLHPGGTVILHLPAFEWLRSEHDAALSTRRRYTRQEVEEIVEAAGLVVKDSWYQNSLLFPLLAAVRLLKRPRAHSQDAVSDVMSLPRMLNALLTQVLRLESALCAHLIRLPFGLSVFCVAQRPAA